MKGKIALIQRGECTFHKKAENAFNVGAVAVVVYNRVDGGVFSGTLGGVVDGRLPVVGISHALGYAWRYSLPRLKIVVAGELDHRFNTTNVIVDVPGGDQNNTIVVGAHLDSVPAGPGINDNGSGSMMIMEIALQLANKYGRIPSTWPALRICWWGGEEEGLLGSEHYVENLKATRPDELQKIVLNLNFDMVASPNFVRGVYNGLSGPDKVKNASASISDFFIDHFRAVGKAWTFSDFNGRSDYGPFIEHGIPAGGLDSGAEKIKTDSERRIFGGLAKTAYDPCYHQACDTVENINHEALDSLAKAAADVLETMLHTVGLREKLSTQKSHHTEDWDASDDGE
jgi:Zn-dependent M28 family amino/carboxypeptidase